MRTACYTPHFIGTTPSYTHLPFKENPVSNKTVGDLKGGNVDASGSIDPLPRPIHYVEVRNVTT